MNKKDCKHNYLNAGITLLKCTKCGKVIEKNPIMYAVEENYYFGNDWD